MEMLPFYILLPPIAGVYFPVPALVGVYVGWIGRMMYSMGYNPKPELRMCRSFGFLVSFCNILMLLICSFWTAFKVMNKGSAMYEVEEKEILKPIEDLITT